jgi:hypothetical protein
VAPSARDEEKTAHYKKKRAGDRSQRGAQGGGETLSVEYDECFLWVIGIACRGL